MDPDASRFRTCGLTLAVLLGLAAPAAATTPENLAGSYDGQWDNLTFSSSGDAAIGISVSGSDVRLSFDMDGFVFGFVDPDIVVLHGTVQGDQIVVQETGDAVFGDVSATIDCTTGALSAAPRT